MSLNINDRVAVVDNGPYHGLVGTVVGLTTDINYILVRFDGHATAGMPVARNGLHVLGAGVSYPPYVYGDNSHTNQAGRFNCIGAPLNPAPICVDDAGGVSSSSSSSSAGIWTPADAASLVVHADFSNTSNISDTAGAVTGYVDEVGNTFVATGATISTGTRTLNSLNVLDFASTDHYLDLNSAALTFSAPFTIIMVSKCDNAAAFKWQMGLTASNGDDLQIGTSTSAWVFRIISPTTHDARLDEAVLANREVATLMVAHYSSGPEEMDFYVNGTQGNVLPTITNAFTPTGCAMNIGTGSDVSTGQSAEGYIAELCICGGELLDYDTVQPYFLDKWGIG